MLISKKHFIRMKPNERLNFSTFMKKITVFLLFIAAATSSSAQNVTVGPGEKPLLKSLIKTPVEGSAYFNDRYGQGKIKTVGQKEFEVKNLRYNLETQQLEYTENDQVYAIQDSVQSFILSDPSGKTHTFEKAKNITPRPFFELLVNGRKKLYKLNEAKKQTTEDFYTKRKTSKMVRQDSYFAGEGDKFQKINPSVKGLSSALANHREQIKTFITQENLDLKSDADLVAVFKFYNSLY
jgi:hypothetical protein